VALRRLYKDGDAGFDHSGGHRLPPLRGMLLAGAILFPAWDLD
jgi:hypothetical protein